MENYPPAAFYFELVFKDEKVRFQEISGLTKGIPTEEITTGGENHYKYKLPTQPRPVNFVLKRGVLPINSKFIAWCNHSLNEGLTGSVETCDVSIKLVDTEDTVLKEWLIFDASPVKYSIAEFSNRDNNVAFELIELAYKYMKNAE